MSHLWKSERFVLSTTKTRRSGFNKNARTVRDLRPAMCVTTLRGHTEKHDHLARPSNNGPTTLEMCNQNESLRLPLATCLTDVLPTRTNIRNEGTTFEEDAHVWSAPLGRPTWAMWPKKSSVLPK